MIVRNKLHTHSSSVSTFRSAPTKAGIPAGVPSRFRGTARPLAAPVQMSSASGKRSFLGAVMHTLFPLHFYYFAKVKTTNLVRYFGVIINTYIATELTSYLVFGHNLKFGQAMVDAFSSSAAAVVAGLYVLSFGIPFVGGMLSRSEPKVDPFLPRGIDDESVAIDRARLWTPPESLRSTHAYFREKNGVHAILYNLAWGRFGAKLGWGVLGLTSYALALAAFATKTAVGVSMGAFFGAGFGPVLFVGLGSLLIPSVRAAVRQVLQNSFGLPVNRALGHWAPSLSTDFFQLTKFSKVLGLGVWGAGLFGATLTLAAPFGLGYGLVGVMAALGIPVLGAVAGMKNPPPSPYGMLFALVEKSPKLMGTLAAAGWSWFLTNTFLPTAPKHAAIVEWIAAKGPGPAAVVAALFAGPYIFRALFSHDLANRNMQRPSLWHLMHAAGKRRLIPMAQAGAAVFGVFGVLERYLDVKALFGAPFRTWGFGETLANALNQAYGAIGLGSFGFGETTMAVAFSLLIAAAVGDAKRIDREDRLKNLRPSRRKELEADAAAPGSDPTLDANVANAPGVIISSVYDPSRK